MPTIYCDNIGALSLAANPVFHARTKHVEVDFHFIREKIVANQLQVSHISPTDQIADIFTKVLSTAKFQYRMDKLLPVFVAFSTSSCSPLSQLEPINLRRNVKPP